MIGPLSLLSRASFKQRMESMATPAELGESSNIELIIKNFKDKHRSKHIEDGLFVNPVEFGGFARHKIVQQIEKLSTQYKEFTRYKLKDVSFEINLSKKFEEYPNTIYIPKIGNSPVISSLKNAKLKHQNYFQVKYYLALCLKGF